MNLFTITFSIRDYFPDGFPRRSHVISTPVIFFSIFFTFIPFDIFLSWSIVPIAALISSVIHGAGGRVFSLPGAQLSKHFRKVFLFLLYNNMVHLKNTTDTRKCI